MASSGRGISAADGVPIDAARRSIDCIPMGNGRFITFEGGEGTGKSTQARRLAERLVKTGEETVLTREPGGSERAEQIREFLLSEKGKSIGALAEAILFSAARDDHLEHLIRPALGEGKWVISDRFADSTRVYQGAANLGASLVATLEHVIVGENRPDLTLIMDLPVEKGLSRASERRAENGGALDGFEARSKQFHQTLRDNFLAIAEAEPSRCVVIDADQSEDAVADAVWAAVEERLKPARRG